ncbi:MAG TPA: S8 family serine peptidase [Lysobacter sp.]
MKQKTLVSALGVSLALMFVAGVMSAAPGNPAQDRVLIKYKSGGKGPVQSALNAAHAKVHYSFDNIGIFAATVPAQALKGLRNNPNVEFIEPDQLRYPTAQTVPYGIDMVQAREVWDANLDDVIDPGAPTGEGIRVCVIDSGIYAGHEDFAGVNIVGGFPSGKWQVDNCGHGTHVAGTIVAAHNTTGVVGVSPGKASLFIVKVFGNDVQTNCGYTFSSQLIDAANRCHDAGAKVINMSLGGGGSRGEEMAFRSLEKRGVLSIAAAGNHGVPTTPTDAYLYPASYESVVSVAAINSSKGLASFSAKNDQVELAAPGVSVLSTYPLGPADPVVSGGDSYPAIPMTNSFVGQATAPLVDGGTCNTALPAGDTSWSGKVVLCQRGAATFLLKSQNVASGGGVAAVIYNNVAGALGGTLGDNLAVIPPIPVVGISMADGQALQALHLGDATTVDTQLPLNFNGYAFLNGTSMATPHVSGVAAVIWSANPGWTNKQVREALSVTAEDLGAAGYDTSFGWGLVQAKDALDELQ